MEQIDEQLKNINIFYDTLPRYQTGQHMCDATTSIGLRREQEDRMILCPRLYRDDISFYGVFDGTAGNYASEFAHKNFLRELLKFDAFQDIITLTANETYDRVEIAIKLKDIFRKTFMHVDKLFLEEGQVHNYGYAASTGVTVFLMHNLLTVAHVGDSRACIVKERNGIVKSEMITLCHKPNNSYEFKRIQEAGGFVVYLSSGKPFIRGGDFQARIHRGERPKQLNYSRAFGGKELKSFGLIAEPDVSVFEVASDDRLVILGSDGLWDVLSANEASQIAFHAKNNGLSPSKEIVKYAINAMPLRNVRDNITVVTVFLNHRNNTNTTTSAPASGNGVNLSSNNGNADSQSSISYVDTFSYSDTPSLE